MIVDLLYPVEEKRYFEVSPYTEMSWKEASWWFSQAFTVTIFSYKGIRKILIKYTKEAGIDNSISPHTLRHFLFTWIKKKGLEIYSRLSLEVANPNMKKGLKIFWFDDEVAEKGLILNTRPYLNRKCIH